MNLRDIPERRAPALDADFNRWYQQVVGGWDLARPPQMVVFPRRETQVAWNDVWMAGPDAQPNYEMLPEHEAIVRRLHEQWAWLQRAGFDRDRRDLPDIRLHLTAREWNTVLRWLPREQLMRDFGPEGVELNFRGVLLAVDR